MKARGLITEIEVPSTWDDNGTTRQTSDEYPFVYKDPVSQTGTYTALRVDWGDGTSNDYTTGTFHAHSYTTAGTYKVRFSSSNGVLPKMQWANASGSPKQLKKIEFSNVKFSTFSTTILWNSTSDYRCSNIEYFNYDIFRNNAEITTQIENLSRDKTGTNICLRSESFEHLTGLTNLRRAFYGTTIKSVPDGLLDNNANVSVLHETFAYSSVETVPAGLFSKLQNVTEIASLFDSSSLLYIPQGLLNVQISASGFGGLFRNCSSLTGDIPDGLFDNCTNATVFKEVFRGTKVTYIPDDLFDNCPNVTTLEGCFRQCSLLTGNAPDLWVSHASANGTLCFRECTGLTNYTDIPDGWK